MIHRTYHELANLFIVTMTFEHAGDSFGEAEVHTFDHAHFVSNGSMRVTVNGQTTDYPKHSFIHIAAGLPHTMTAREDGTVGHCIHALRSQDGSGEPLDPALVPVGMSALEAAHPITA